MTIPFNDSRMNDQVIMRAVRDAPVQPPFEHRKRLVAWQLSEWRAAVSDKLHLRPDPPPQTARGRDLDVEVGIGSFSEGVVGI